MEIGTLFSSKSKITPFSNSRIFPNLKFSFNSEDIDIKIIIMFIVSFKMFNQSINISIFVINYIIFMDKIIFMHNI